MNQGGYATGSRSGIRDKGKPNWRKVEKAKKEEQRQEKEKKRMMRMAATAKKEEEKRRTEESAARKEVLFANIRLAARMFRAGWTACETGDAYQTGWMTALRKDGLFDSAMAASSRSFFERDP